jgi:hypothetical protein
MVARFAADLDVPDRSNAVVLTIWVKELELTRHGFVQQHGNKTTVLRVSGNYLV